MSRLCALGVAAAILLAAACDRTTSASVRVPASPTMSPGASMAAPAPTPTPTGPFCPGVNADHHLLIESIGAGQIGSVVVRDVQDPNHGVTLCELPAGAPRFVSGTKVALIGTEGFKTLDLISGLQTTVLSYSQDDGAAATWDWTSDGQLFAYGFLTPDGRSLVFHLVAGGADRVLTTVSVPSPVPRPDSFWRIEFSPDGQYVAIGSPTSVDSGDNAAVQVRRLDGSLVFSSGGTGRQTWAGESPKLYFEGPSGVETWDPINGVSRLPIVGWRYPIRSAGGRWLAYQVLATYWSELRIIDTRSGADRAIGRTSQDVAWVTPTLLRFDDVVSCPSSPPPGFGGPICTSRSVIYDTSDGSKTVTVPAHVFDAWPRGTEPWY